MNNLSDDKDIQAAIDHPESLAEFVALLDRCKAQVEADPESYLENLHLYGLQHGIFLRLCHGNIPEYAIEHTA